MGSLANSSSLQTTIQENPLPLPLSAFSQPSLLTPKPSPRLRLMPTMAVMDTDSPTGTVMVCTATMVDMATLTLTDTTMARGPLMQSPRPMHSMVIMVMAWDTTVWATTVLATTGWVMLVMLTLTLMDTTMARGLLMPSPLLMPTMATTTDMLHTVITVDTTATPTPIVPTDTTDIITKLLLFC